MNEDKGVNDQTPNQPVSNALKNDKNNMAQDNTTKDSSSIDNTRDNISPIDSPVKDIKTNEITTQGVLPNDEKKPSDNPPKDNTTTVNTAKNLEKKQKSKAPKDKNALGEEISPPVSDNVVSPTPRSIEDFIVRPPLYIKGVPVADNLKNRMLMREIDRESRLQEKIAKTHPIENFYPYFPPIWGLNRLELATDKTAHSRIHQRELHEWHKIQKNHERRMNQEFKEQHGHRTRVDKRVQRAPPSDEVRRWKEKTHVRRWAPKKKHTREFKEEVFKR